MHLSAQVSNQDRELLYWFVCAWEVADNKLNVVLIDPYQGEVSDHVEIALHKYFADACDITKYYTTSCEPGWEAGYHSVFVFLQLQRMMEQNGGSLHEAGTTCCAQKAQYHLLTYTHTHTVSHGRFRCDSARQRL